MKGSLYKNELFVTFSFAAKSVMDSFLAKTLIARVFSFFRRESRSNREGLIHSGGA